MDAQAPGRITLAVAAPLLAACSGAPSALDPAGRSAEVVADLFWLMATGAALIWLLVVGLALYAGRRRRAALRRPHAILLVAGAGFVLPGVVLAALLAHGLILLPQLQAGGDGLQIRVSAERWWWRVRYTAADGGVIALANEIRVPVGERVELQLDSRDVIHAFWVPALGGKVDMIPGRRTRLALEARRSGVFDGVCAEYCGLAHARMAFAVVAMDREAFAAWLAQQAAPRSPPQGALARAGERAFLANGCGGCHSVRGTGAAGVIGPDLTHLASRGTIGAGALLRSREALRRWIADAAAHKPGVLMPAFHMLPAEELDAIAAYLDGLG